jgi:putative hemolysin
MTPRRLVDMVDLSGDPETIRRTVVDSVHSRFPVHEGNSDEVLGVIQAKDLLDDYLAGAAPDVRARVRTAPVVPDTADALDAVSIIKESQVHMVLVHDEYGHFEGVVTNADILEAIVGASRTDEGPPEPDAVRREDGSWLLSGSMAADEMAERLSIAIPQERQYHTAAGFALDRIGHLPAVGESFDDQGWRFEIVDIDGRRIDKILARRATSARRRVA